MVRTKGANISKHSAQPIIDVQQILIFFTVFTEEVTLLQRESRSQPLVPLLPHKIPLFSMPG